MLKVVRVNMKTKNINIEEFDSSIVFGNRGLIAKTLIEEVDPNCDPLGAENKLVFATGLFTGYNFPTGNRLSSGAKSPLTGTIKESNVGGTAGANLALQGIKMIIFEDQPDDGKWYLLRIDEDGNIALESADRLVAKGTYETAKELKKDKSTSVCAIGPAGERMYKVAAIQVTDQTTGTPSRSAGRGGMGAVMGSKHLKAIVIERPKEKAKLPMVDEAKVKELIKDLQLAVANGASAMFLRMSGTNGGSMMTIGMNAYPVHNFSGRMLTEEEEEKIDNAAYTERIAEYGGKQGVACQPGCPIRCSNYYHNENSELVTSGLEYETIALSGPNCDIYDWDYIAKFDHICDDFGVDTIDLGNAIAIAMDAGYIPWGDVEAATRILKEMKEGVGFGPILGNGAQAVGDYFKHDRVPTCKNQAFPAYDPRAVKGLGVTFATFSQGADHTAGGTISSMVDQALPDGQVEVSKGAQFVAATGDNFCCMFANDLVTDADNSQKVIELLGAIYGIPFDAEILTNIGKQTYDWEKEFNARAGFTAKDDVLPKFLREEKIETDDSIFDVDQSEIENIAAI